MSVPFSDEERAGQYLESVEPCHESMANFLADRYLCNLTEPDVEQRRRHQEKCDKEVAYEEKETAKGKPMLKKYRHDFINSLSKCGAQYVNNIHMYYGNGSVLQGDAAAQYAEDFVVSKKKVTNEWLNDSVKLVNRLPRSVSCTHIECTDTLEHFKAICNFNSSIFDMDPEFMFPYSCRFTPNRTLFKGISNTFKCLIKRVNGPELKVGKLQVFKVLFATDDKFAYVIPSNYNMFESIKTFSKQFSDYWNNLPQDTQKNFGAFGHGNYWEGVNVVLYMKQFEEEGTQFRRARFVCRLIGPENEDLYLEIDSGRLVTGTSGPGCVRRLPQKWAREPSAFIQVFFPYAKNKEDVSEHVRQIRRTGTAYIGCIKTCDRQEAQEAYYFVPNNGAKTKAKPWNDNRTALLVPMREYQEPSMTNFFCEERDCMGLCGTTDFYKKSSRYN
uniref:Uncharacterized protein n=1 Tax=Caenorhabditis japonica TaxID=281687 RepID=A0A8R1E0Q9_CAEJA